MLYFVAVSSSPSTPKQSPGLKSDAPSSGPTLEPITPILPPKGKSKCSNSTLVSYLSKYYCKGENIHRIRPVTINMHLEHIVEEKKSRKQSFSPVGLSDAGENSARKRSKSTEKGAKSEQPQSSRKRSKSINEKGEACLHAK